MRRRRVLATTLGLIAIALLAGCSDSGSRPAASASSASTSTTTLRSSASSGLGTVPTSSSSGTQPCVASAEASVAPAATAAVSADVNGDGADDVLAVRSAGATYSLRVDLAGDRGSLETVIEDASGVVPARVLGASGPNVFVVVDAGASATIVGIYQVDGCSLTRLATATGGPESFPIGGTVTHLDGLRCGPEGFLDVLSADSSDGETYSTTDQRLRRGEGVLDEEGPATTGTLWVQDPALQSYAHLDCPGVEAL